MINTVSQPATLLPPELLWLLPIAGLLAMIWGNVKVFWGHTIGYIIVEAAVDNDLCYPLLRVLQREAKVLPFNKRRFGVWRMPNREHAMWIPCLAEYPAFENRLFWFRRTIIFVKRNGDTFSIVHLLGTFDSGAFFEELIVDLRKTDAINYNTLSSMAPNRFGVRLVSGKGSVHARALLKENDEPPAPSRAVGQLADSTPEASWLRDPRHDEETRRLLRWKNGIVLSDFYRKELEEDPYSSLALPPHFSDIRQDFKRWFSSGDWYSSRGISWRRGYLFHGPPGSGKTSMAVALAREFKIPVYVFDLSSMSNEELQRRWEECSNPCIVLIEDIHAVFDGKRNLAQELGGGLTFDCLLNVIGGANNNRGTTVIVTTNEPDKLDAALGKPTDGGASSRPGRLDRVFYFGPPDLDQKRQLGEKMKLTASDVDDLLLTSGPDESYAQFSERCVDRALTQYWTNKT